MGIGDEIGLAVAIGTVVESGLFGGPALVVSLTHINCIFAYMQSAWFATLLLMHNRWVTVSYDILSAS